jgi:hypothetical protein
MFLQYDEKLSLSVRSSPIYHTHRNGMPANMSRECIIATHFIPSHTSRPLQLPSLPFSTNTHWLIVSCLCLVFWSLRTLTYISTLETKHVPHLRALKSQFSDYCSVPGKSVQIGITVQHCTVDVSFDHIHVVIRGAAQ